MPSRSPYGLSVFPERSVIAGFAAGADLGQVDAVSDAGIAVNRGDDAATLPTRAMNHVTYRNARPECRDGAMVRDVAEQLRNRAVPWPDLVDTVHGGDQAQGVPHSG